MKTGYHGVNIKKKVHTVAVVGGGASGMAAALAARERIDNYVVLLERQSRVGRKLLATGNGRCNLTNTCAEPGRYHGADRDFIFPAMERFGVAETLDWFRGMGLITHEEPGGRVYPLSDAASSVSDTLRLAMNRRGVDVICSFDVTEARTDGRTFTITSATGKTVEADRLIVACGGMAGGRLGGTKSGYELLKGFGHRITPLKPSLVQLKTDNTWTRAMKGVRTQAELTLETGGAVVARACGEVQFTDYGVTGPGVFDLSRAAAHAGPESVVVLRLLPSMDQDELFSYMHEKQAAYPGLKSENLLTGTLHNTVARTVLRRAGLPLDAYLWSLDEKALAAAADTVARFELPLAGTLGFDDAQVTAGGARTGEFFPETMESRLVHGLYACGEVLDIDGDCGGFNLQWAWSSGRLAGMCAANPEGLL